MSWLGTAFGALFVVAVLVAWWEHMLQSTRPPAPIPAPEPRAVTVDLQIDKLNELPSAGDVPERRATLDGAVGRASQASAETARSGWMETSPMVLHPAGPPSAQPAAPVEARPTASSGA